ncbi:MAG: DUF4920 domain-containing protein [Arenimonas sp.]
MSKKLFIFASLLFFAGLAQAKNYGETMPKGKAVDIAVASKNLDNYVNKPAKFRGRITKVCQMEGCWLMIESNAQAARIKTKDHGFVIPKDSKGEAIVFGELKRVELKPEVAKHLAEDAGVAAPEPVATSELQIIASSISIK